MIFLIPFLFACSTPEAPKPSSQIAVEIDRTPLKCKSDQDCWLHQVCKKKKCEAE